MAMTRAIDHPVVEKTAAVLRRIGVRRDETILVGLSGGPDSVALLHALIALGKRFGHQVAAAHFNHRLRGEESARDEGFVRELCARLGVQLFVESAADLLPGAQNLEEWARELRYEFLHRAAERRGAAYIALGHHAGDQAETVLMRLLRGSGVAGLKAMAEAGPGKLIRPMLALQRGAILDYLDAIGAGFVTDSSNSSPAILRNRLRDELLPMLERDYAPGLRRRLVELAGEMRSIDGLMTAMAEAEMARMLAADGSLDLGAFPTLQPALAAALLRAFIRVRVGSTRRMARAHVEAVRRLCLEGPPNGAVDLPGGWRAERQYGVLKLCRGLRTAGAGFCVPLNVLGRTIVPESGFVFEGCVAPAKDAPVPATLLEALFDADAMRRGLVARSFIRGDRIQPFGMEGSRKVKDVFIDHKLPRARRAAFPLVVLGDEVVWIPGLVRGRGAPVTAATVRVVRLSAAPILR